MHNLHCKLRVQVEFSDMYNVRLFSSLHVGMWSTALINDMREVHPRFEHIELCIRLAS